MSTMTIPRRFRGPSTSGNGGYTAGRLARLLTGDERADRAVTVRLRTPPPLEAALTVVGDGHAAVASHGHTVVAEASLATLPLQPVPAVPFAQAESVQATYAGLRNHPFPECVVCGPAREHGDGMRLFPGLTAPGRTACAWRPDASLADAAGLLPTEIIWAALDCPGGWTAEIEGRPMVLGTMTGRVDGTPVVGEACVVTGELRAAVGRKAETATSLYGADGRPLAHAYAVWVQIDAAAFNRTFAPAR